MARGHCRQDHHNLALAHAGVSIRGRSPGFSFIASRYMIRRANRPGLSGAKIRSIWDGGLGHLPNLRLGLNGIDDDGAHRHILSTRKRVRSAGRAPNEAVWSAPNVGPDPPSATSAGQEQWGRDSAPIGTAIDDRPPQGQPKLIGCPRSCRQLVRLLIMMLSVATERGSPRGRKLLSPPERSSRDQLDHRAPSGPPFLGSQPVLRRPVVRRPDHR